jgi:chromosome segregation ATPase
VIVAVFDPPTEADPLGALFRGREGARARKRPREEDPCAGASGRDAGARASTSSAFDELRSRCAELGEGLAHMHGLAEKEVAASGSRAEAAEKRVEAAEKRAEAAEKRAEAAEKRAGDAEKRLKEREADIEALEEGNRQFRAAFDDFTSTADRITSRLPPRRS